MSLPSACLLVEESTRCAATCSWNLWGKDSKLQLTFLLLSTGQTTHHTWENLSVRINGRVGKWKLLSSDWSYFNPAQTGRSVTCWLSVLAVDCAYFNASGLFSKITENKTKYYIVYSWLCRLSWVSFALLPFVFASFSLLYCQLELSVNLRQPEHVLIRTTHTHTHAHTLPGHQCENYFRRQVYFTCLLFKMLPHILTLSVSFFVCPISVCLIWWKIATGS